MNTDNRERIRYPAVEGKAVFLFFVAAVMVGWSLTLARLDLPTWLSVLIALVVFGVLGVVVIWTLRAGTTLTPGHLRIRDTFSTRTVPWQAIEAVCAGSRVEVLVDGGWRQLHPDWSTDAQLWTVHSWWTAHRGTHWRPPVTVPPLPEDAVGHRPLRGWWRLPAWITVLIGVPVALWQVPRIGLPDALMIVGATFVGYGSVSVRGMLNAHRPMPPAWLLRALTVLAVGAATVALLLLWPGW